MKQTVDAKEDMLFVLQPTTVDAVRMGEWPEEEAVVLVRPVDGLITTAAKK